jgi:hypothetical protein
VEEKIAKLDNEEEHDAGDAGENEEIATSAEFIFQGSMILLRSPVG